MKIELEPGDRIAAAVSAQGGVLVITERGALYYMKFSDYKQCWTVEVL